MSSPNVGRITQVIGSTLDAQFSEDSMPAEIACMRSLPAGCASIQRLDMIPYRMATPAHNRASMIALLIVIPLLALTQRKNG